MIELAIIVLAVSVVYKGIQVLGHSPKTVVPGKEPPAKLTSLLDYANRLYGEKKYITAEKAYLEALKIDHKNVQAYKRLGLIYSVQRNYEDAIECFQIAAQLAPNAQNYHNLGIVYLENQNLVKAVAALEKGIMFEPTVQIYQALAKAHHRLADPAKMIVALERAAEIAPEKQNLQALAEAYALNHDRPKAEETYRKILKIDPNNAKAKQIVGQAASS